MSRGLGASSGQVDHLRIIETAALRAARLKDENADTQGAPEVMSFTLLNRCAGVEFCWGPCP